MLWDPSVLWLWCPLSRPDFGQQRRKCKGPHRGRVSASAWRWRSSLLFTYCWAKETNRKIAQWCDLELCESERPGWAGGWMPRCSWTLECYPLKNEGPTLSLLRDMYQEMYFGRDWRLDHAWCLSVNKWEASKEAIAILLTLYRVES